MTMERRLQKLFADALTALYVELVKRLSVRLLTKKDDDENGNGMSDEMEVLIALLLAWWLAQLKDLEAEISRIFVGINLYNDIQFRKAIQQLYGIVLPQSTTLGMKAEMVTPVQLSQKIFGATADVQRVEAFVDELKKNFVYSSEKVVEGIGRTFLDVTDRDVRKQILQGTPVSEILQSIQDRAQKAIEKAAASARLEVTTANSLLSRERQVSIDLQRYTWRTCRDDRVRASHAQLDGTVQLWSDAPSVGHPGEDYNCRCWAEPVRNSDS